MHFNPLGGNDFGRVGRNAMVGLECDTAIGDVRGFMLDVPKIGPIKISSARLFVPGTSPTRIERFAGLSELISLF